MTDKNYIEEDLFLPDSSALYKARYRRDESLLTIWFYGRIAYTYLGVPPEVWEEFCSADSQGTFFNLYIRGFYSFHEGEPNAETRSKEEPRGD